MILEKLKTLITALGCYSWQIFLYSQQEHADLSFDEQRAKFSTLCNPQKGHGTDRSKANINSYQITYVIHTIFKDG